MKKIIVSGVVILAFALYAIFYHKSTQTIPATTGEGKEGAGTTSATVTSGSDTSTGQYKNGTYTGSAANAYYGTLQVKAVIQNGKITDVQFLQSPHDQQESIEVNQDAMPKLKQEAIQSQSSNVDIITGATQSSQAFKESLASALTQAK
jgi:uncharacterized protein with FMN-binding domain